MPLFNMCPSVRIQLVAKRRKQNESLCKSDSINNNNNNNKDYEAEGFNFSLARINQNACRLLYCMNEM